MYSFYSLVKVFNTSKFPQSILYLGLKFQTWSMHSEMFVVIVTLVCIEVCLITNMCRCTYFYFFNCIGTVLNLHNPLPFHPMCNPTHQK